MSGDTNVCESGSWGPASDGAPDLEAAQSLLLKNPENADNEFSPVNKDDGDQQQQQQKDPDAAAEDEEGAGGDKKGLIISLITLILSIPALLGAWCWPALIIGLLSGSASAAARVLGHEISFGITAAILILLNIYMIWSIRKYRRGLSHIQCWGPLYLTVIASFLIMADLLRHVLLDNGIWENGGGEYRDNCNSETIRCLSVTGWLITFGCTYVGFILLFIGTLWNANIIAKFKQIYKKCTILYRRHKKSKETTRQ